MNTERSRSAGAWSAADCEPTGPSDPSEEEEGEQVGPPLSPSSPLLRPHSRGQDAEELGRPSRRRRSWTAAQTRRAVDAPDCRSAPQRRSQVDEGGEGSGFREPPPTAAASSRLGERGGAGRSQEPEQRYRSRQELLSALLRSHTELFLSLPPPTPLALLLFFHAPFGILSLLSEVYRSRRASLFLSFFLLSLL